MRLILILLVVVGAIGASACDEPDLGAFDTNALVELLRAGGATVERRGSVSQPFFSVPGTTLSVSGENVQAFEYRDAGAADAGARLVSADGGTIGTTAVSWIAAPHFHRCERVIALYVGDVVAVKSALSSAMGPQFAGR